MDRPLSYTVVAQGAPTLAGIKPASLFSSSLPCPLLMEQLGQVRSALAPHKIRLRLLRQRPALLLLYRPQAMAGRLSQADTAAFLSRLGYQPAGVEGMVDQLARRLIPGRPFPHEIGLFLGYPLRDVAGFIRCQGRGARAAGLWKCYGDEAQARQFFALCRRCTGRALERYAQGGPAMGPRPPEG